MHREKYGFGYLFSVGIPSAWDLSWFGHGDEIYTGNVAKHRHRWFEKHANERAEKHFDGLYDKWDYINYPTK